MVPGSSWSWHAGEGDCDFLEAAFDAPSLGRAVEATVARVRNGIVVNYTYPYQGAKTLDDFFRREPGAWAAAIRGQPVPR